MHAIVQWAQQEELWVFLGEAFGFLQPRAQLVLRSFEWSLASGELEFQTFCV